MDSWTIADQAPLSMEFSRQEYQSRLPFPSPGDLPDPEIGPASCASPALAGGFFPTGASWEAHSVEGLAIKWLQKSCLTLCNPMDYTVHEILRARILEWAAFSFSRGSSQPRDQTQVSRIAGRFFTSWATREALGHNYCSIIHAQPIDIQCIGHLILLSCLRFSLFSMWHTRKPTG